MLALAGLISSPPQTAPDPTEVLSQARAKVADTMKRLPKYACPSTMQIDLIVLAPSNTFVFPLEKRHVIAAGTTPEWVTVDADATSK